MWTRLDGIVTGPKNPRNVWSHFPGIHCMMHINVNVIEIINPTMELYINQRLVGIPKNPPTPHRGVRRDCRC